MVDTIILRFDGQNFTSNNQTNEYGIVGTDMTIDWGDGEVEELIASKKFNHTYSADEVHTIVINGATITGIDNNCFKNCVGLIGVELPASITSIGTSSFDGCNNLNIIVLNWTEPTSIITFNSNWIGNNTSIRYIIPDDTLNSYLSKSYPNATEYDRHNVPTPERIGGNAYSTRLSGYFYNKINSILNEEFESTDITTYGLELDNNTNKINISTTSKLINYLKAFTKLLTDKLSDRIDELSANKLSKSVYDTYIEDLETRLTNIESSVTDYWETVYPVGSVFITFDTRNPSEIFGGGRWKRIEGKFLWSHKPQKTAHGKNTMAENSLRETGGAKTVRLTVDEMPSHEHGMNSGNWTGKMRVIVYKGNQDVVNTNLIDSSESPHLDRTMPSGNDFGAKTFNLNAGHIHNSVGGGGYHENRPPYIVVNMWERTA